MPVLAADQDRGVAVGKHADRLLHRAHRLARPDEHVRGGFGRGVAAGSTRGQRSVQRLGQLRTADDQLRRMATGRDDDFAAAWRRLHGVKDQIVERAAHLIGIEARGPVLGLEADPDAVGRGKLGVRGNAGCCKRGEGDGFTARPAALGHGQQPAQHLFEPSDLAKDRGERLVLVLRIGQHRVLRPQPHRGDRIADFVRQSRGDAADRRQPLGGRDLLRQAVGALPRIGEPASGFVQRHDDAVELALAGGGKHRQRRDVVGLQRRLDLPDVTRPSHRQPSEQDGGEHHRQENAEPGHQQFAWLYADPATPAPAA